MNTRDNQHGGIVIFAIIGILLIGLLAGGLYLGKQQARIARDNAPEPVAIDTEKEATDSTESGTTASPIKEPEPPKPQPQASTPAPAPQSPAPSTPRASVPASGPSQVASTGPTETALGVIVLGAMAFVGTVFMQSHARLRRSALIR